MFYCEECRCELCRDCYDTRNLFNSAVSAVPSLEVRQLKGRPDSGVVDAPEVKFTAEAVTVDLAGAPTLMCVTFTCSSLDEEDPREPGIMLVHTDANARAALAAFRVMAKLLYEFRKVSFPERFPDEEP